MLLVGCAEGELSRQHALIFAIIMSRVANYRLGALRLRHQDSQLNRGPRDADSLEPYLLDRLKQHHVRHEIRAISRSSLRFKERLAVCIPSVYVTMTGPRLLRRKDQPLYTP